MSGTHRVPGNKNAALPMIAAALLTDEPVTLVNLPEIDDVDAMLEAAQSLGAEVVRNVESRSATIVTRKIRSATIAADLAARIRTSFLLAGLLLARARCGVRRLRQTSRERSARASCSRDRCGRVTGMPRCRRPAGMRSGIGVSTRISPVLRPSGPKLSSDGSRFG